MTWALMSYGHWSQYIGCGRFELDLTIQQELDVSFTGICYIKNVNTKTRQQRRFGFYN